MSDPVTLDLLARLVERVLEGQRRAEARFDRIESDLGEIKSRLGLLEGQYASVSRRLDLLDGRVQRIERRLDLVEA